MHPANNPWSSSQPNWYQNPFYTFADVFGAARYHYTSPTSHGNEELMSQQGTNPWPPSTAPWDVNNYDSQPLENLWNQRLPPSPPIPSSPITFDYDSNYYDETIEHHSVAVNMPVVEEINEIQRNQGAYVSSTCQPVGLVESQKSFQFTAKIRKVTSLLDKLLTADRSDVPNTVSELLYCFLEYGTDHKLSDWMSREIEHVLQTTKNNSKIIRVLWVIGYLFLPKYASKLTAVKPLMEKIAARLFWTCLWKTHKNILTREEMRVILKFWREIVPEEITSSIMVRINDATASDPRTNMAWILDDKNIRNGTRMSLFYNKYLLNAPNTSKKEHDKIDDPESKDKKNQEQFILDKRDVIQTTNQKNWEDKLAASKQKSADSLHTHRKFKKQKTGNQGETDKISTKFQPVYSKPVYLVKPLSRTKVTTDTDDNCMSNGGSSGFGNQDQQSSGLSKLELFRKMMEKDEAITSIGGGHKWNDTSLRENKEIYLRQDWTVDDFVYYVCSDEFQTSWDIVKLESGEIRVKIMRK